MTPADGLVLGTTKVIDHGSATQRWNLVILGDGYRLADLGKYHADVQAFVDFLYATPPFNRSWRAVNIFRVDVSSTDSGADDPAGCGDGSAGSGAVAATYFDATFCFGGATRRLLAGNSGTALSVASAQVPQAHATLVIVNSPIYGGAGGSVAWYSTHPQAAEIGVHELAHSAFGLGDEYGDIINTYVGPEPAAPNITKDTNRPTTKWAGDILGTTPLPTTSNANCTIEDPQPSPVPTGTIGLFEGGGRAHCGLYRCEYGCKMRTLGQPFCLACQRRIRTTLAPFGGVMEWQLVGNVGTSAATDFLGTTDDQALVIKTKGAERVRIEADGDLGLGTAQPSARLSVVAANAPMLGGTARSSALLVSAGPLAPAAGSELSLATIGFNTNGNSSSLGIRAVRTLAGADWTSTAIGLGMDVDNTVGAGASLWLHANSNVGVGTVRPSARLSVVAANAPMLGGTARSSALLVSAGPLAPAAGSELSLATIGFNTNGNSSSLGIRAVRTLAGADWTSTAIGLGMDVDNTVRAGASLWLHANSNVGVGTVRPSARLSVVAANAPMLGGTARSSALLVSAGLLAPSSGSEIALATIGFANAAGNSSSLGIRAVRTLGGGDWTSTAIGLGMDVDNTVRAGANLWLYANGSVGIGTSVPAPDARLDVRARIQNQVAITAFTSGAAAAVVGESTSGDGFGVGGISRAKRSAVIGLAQGDAPGVQGQTATRSTTSFGVVGQIGSDLAPPTAVEPGGIGVVGVSPGTGAGGAHLGSAPLGNGVEGYLEGAAEGAAVHALTRGSHTNSAAVYADATAGNGVAGRFRGNVTVQGTLTASAKAFQIDHPLDPDNRLLTHWSVESPEMTTFYAGSAVTTDECVAVVSLPDYFEELNRDFRYQLTVIGQLAQVALEQEIEECKFVIRTDQPNVKVSWLVTGVRRDRYASSHEAEVVREKSEADRGRYLHPELYGAELDSSEDLGHLKSFIDGMETRWKAGDEQGPEPQLG